MRDETKALAMILATALLIIGLILGQAAYSEWQHLSRGYVWVPSTAGHWEFRGVKP